MLHNNTITTGSGHTTIGGDRIIIRVYIHDCNYIVNILRERNTYLIIGEI